MSLYFAVPNACAVIAAVVSTMIIGALWYSPVLFGNLWLKLIGKRPEDVGQADANASMALSIIPAIVSVASLVLLLSFTRAATLLDAVVVASVAAVGFVGMSAFNLVLFEGRSVGLTLLNVGYSFVSLNVAAVIVTLWR
ncbi:MAG: DUF1761 family protein [Chitinivibrionales bacterium]|nr:DUF1761 family protein [Chitinivibrionales bacterium]